MDTANVVPIRLYYQMMNQEALASIVKELKGLNKSLGSTRGPKAFNNMNKSMRTMTSATLSMMFAAQKVQYAFSSMLNPIRDAAGLTDYWNAIMISETADAIDPTIDALDLAGEAMHYINNATGDSLGKMLLFGEATAGTATSLGQAATFGNALGSALGTVPGAGGLITALAGIIGSTVLPIVLLDESNLKAADLYLGGVNEIIDKLPSKEDRMTASITTFGDTVTTLGSIFRTDTTWEQDIQAVEDGLAGVKKGVEDIPSTVPIDVSTPGWDTAHQNLIDMKTAADAIKDKDVIITTTHKDVWIKEISGVKTWVSGLTGGTVLKAVLDSQGLNWISNLLGLAEGGIVTRPTTALIGERGPEAVIPLDRIGSIGGINITINTSTVGGNIDALAREIAEKFKTELVRVRY